MGRKESYSERLRREGGMAASGKFIEAEAVAANDPVLMDITRLIAQVKLCDEFLYAASVDETFGLLDIQAKREALMEAIEALDVPF